MFKRIPKEKPPFFLCLVLLVSSVLYAQETIYTPTTTKIVRGAGTTEASADASMRLDCTLSPDQEEIEVQVSSYVDKTTLTGWRATNPDCQTPNNVCQEIKIENLLMTFILKAKLIKKENEKFLYTSIDANGEIKFKGTATKYWPFSEVYTFDVTRGYTISQGAGLIVYSSDISRVTRIDMNLPFGPDYPQVYKLLQGYNTIDTLSIRASLPRGWVFTYPYDLYKVYPTEVKHNQYAVRYFDKDNPTREVGGAAADGASRVIVQISGVENTVSINDVAIIISDENDGYLENDKQIRNGIFTQTYHAPKDFVRKNYATDLTVGQRAIDLNIKVRNALITHTPLFLFKPPVVLIHGIWSNVKVFSAMAKYLLTEYSGWIFSINYSNDRHFNENVPVIGENIAGCLETTRNHRFAKPIVVKKVDVIAHSMGGILTNLYAASNNYGKDINRIITLDTPHYGSEAANFLMHFIFKEMTPEARYFFLHENKGYEIFKRRMGSIDGGAADDLQVKSRAMIDYNNALAKLDIPVYAITSSHDDIEPSFILGLVYDGMIFKRGPEAVYYNMGFFYWDRRLKLRRQVLHIIDDDPDGYFFEGMGFPPPLPNSHPKWPYSGLAVEYGLFHEKSGSSDFIVSLDSQQGGTTAFFTIPTPDHINVNDNAQVIEKVRNLLNSPISDFDLNGFSPSESYPSARVGPIDVGNTITREKVLFANNEKATNSARRQQKFVITEPSNGAIFKPGEKVTVKVSYDGIAENGISFLTQDGSIGRDDTPPYEYEFIINENFLGPLLIASWTIHFEGPITDDPQDGVEIFVTTDERPALISVSPQGPLYLRKGSNRKLYVEGLYSSGVARDITSINTTHYLSLDSTIARVSRNGIIHGVSDGKTTITIDNNGASMNLAVFVGNLSTRVEDNNVVSIPKEFSLGQNYPNPFNPTTIITYSLPGSSHVILTVYDILGQEVRTLVNQFQKTGTHSIIWDGKNAAGQQVPSGVYLYQLRASNKVQTKKMLLIK